MFLTKLFQSKIVFGESGGGGGGGGGSSSKSSAPKSSPRPKARPAPKPKPKKSGGRNLDADNFAGSNYAPTKNAGTSKAKQEKYSHSTDNDDRMQIPVKTGTDTKNSGGRNLAADMFAGSGYAPTKDAGTSKARQVTYTSATDRADRKEVPVTGATTSFNSKSSVSAKDLIDGNVSEYKSKTGKGGLIVSRGTTLDQAPQVDATSGGKTNSEVYDSTDVRSPSTTTPVITGDGGGGSSAPVTAPETIAPKDGVGGGRDGGKARKSKASKTNEDKIAVKRKSMGISRYQTVRSNPMAINKRKA